MKMFSIWNFPLVRIILIFFFTNTFSIFSLMAAEIDFYGEHSTWIVDRPEGSIDYRFQDFTSLRVRGYLSGHQDMVRPYFLLSASRDRYSEVDFYSESIETVRGGVGVRFSNPRSPIEIYVEGRHVHEKRSVNSDEKNCREVVAIPVLAGATKPFSDYVFARAAWYADINHVMRLGQEDYDAGSAWFRLSTGRISAGKMSITMEPVDTAAYRECYQGCNGWFFAGVGMTAEYASSSFSVSVRGSLGERIRQRSDDTTRSDDAARLLLVINGGF